MDKTIRPVSIPADYSIYAETKNIYSLFKDIMQELIVWKPNDPLTYIVEYLQRTDKQRFRILVLGPACSGKRTLSRRLSKDCSLTLISRDNFLEKASQRDSGVVAKCVKNDQPIPSDTLINILKIWFDDEETIRNGWIMDGLIENKEQAIALANIGNFPTHCIILDAADEVLMERSTGKLIHPGSGDVYHSVFDMPSDEAVASELVKPTGYSKAAVAERLRAYRNNIQYLRDFYKNVSTIMNVDMSKEDVYARVYAIAARQKRNDAPNTPRIILLGPTGAGKKTQADLLAQKYKLNKMILSELIDREIVNKTKIGQLCKEFMDKEEEIDDEIILDLLEQTISNFFCESCGWILVGFPKTEDQATKIDARKIGPNRVIFMNISDEVAYERLTERAVDPISGYRYHLTHRPPPTSLIRDRLEVQPSDHQKAVQARLTKYRKLEAGLESYYKKFLCKPTIQCQYVDASMDVYRVFESIESIIVEPMPAGLSQ